MVSRFAPASTVTGAVHQLDRIGLQAPGLADVERIAFERAPGFYQFGRLHLGIDRVLHVETGKVALRGRGGFDAEAVNQQILGALRVANGKWEGKTKSKSMKVGGLKGEMFTGRYKGAHEDWFSVGMFSGKGKQGGVSILMIVHDRELRVDKKYFTTVLKSFKAAK